MFSRRTAWDRTPNALTLQVEMRRARALPVLDLTESNPTRCGLAWDPAELGRALAAPHVERYDPDPRGLRSAREAVAAFLAGRGAHVPPERIFLTASTSEAYSLVFKLLCDAGDAVSVPQPSYPLFEFLATLDGVATGSYRLRLSDRWRLSTESLAANLPERARAVLVVLPNNPTGAFLTHEEAAALGATCASHGLALVSDEVFATYAWRGADVPGPRTLLGAGARAGCLTFLLDGLSKSCGLPQVKLGWIAVDGPPDLVEEACERLELVADTYLSASTPAQLAAPALLASGAAFRERVLDRIELGLARVRDAASACGATLLPAEAGWCATLELPEGAHEERVTAQLLERDGVLVHPGHFFDLPGEHVVVSLLTEPPALDAGLERLSAALSAGRG